MRDLVRDRQPEPRAARLGTPERAQHFSARERARETRASVGEEQLDPAFASGEPRLNRACARSRRLDRVLDQIPEQPPQLIGVAAPSFNPARDSRARPSFIAVSGFFSSWASPRATSCHAARLSVTSSGTVQMGG